jgi:hypothetical protein
MGIEFGLLDRTGECLVNTQHAPLAALLAHYQQNETLQGLATVEVAMKSVDYTPTSKEQFAEQSTLSRTLDELTLKQIDQLRAASASIWHQHSQTVSHDWRGFLWLDFDLSGLPCGKQGEGSRAGYFSDKKTSPGAS